jgi:heptosyltransferase-2
VAPLRRQPPALAPASALTTHVAQRYLEAVRFLDAAPDHGPARLYTTPADRAAAAALADPDTVVLAPGARHATKRWPTRHWRDLAARLSAAGKPVVAVGLDEDRFVLRAPLVREAFGLPLRVAAAICARAQVVVANDSGIMHVATAVDTPVVALYGPTEPALGHAPYRARASLLVRTLPCRPCSLSGGPVCPLSHHHCLETIEPADVETAIAKLT